MTKEERGQIVWHILIQWITSRGELIEWMDGMNANDEEGGEGWGMDISMNPNYGGYLVTLNSFSFMPTSGSNYAKWNTEWAPIAQRLSEDMPVAEIDFF